MSSIASTGIAPTIVRALMRYGKQEVRKYDLSALRIIASTGEPWNPDSWLWLFRTVGGSRLPIINYSGGTEIGGGILTGTVLHPLKPCSFAGSCPGMAAEVVDEKGDPVPRGTVGELVMRIPSMGLTRGLWKDPQRYLQSYWSTLPDMWVHGDFASIDADGYWYVHGRSDDTIKIAGKRVGPAEIESILLTTGKVTEAAVIGAPFKPRLVVFVADLPKTRNMKIMRRVVRSVWTGQPPGDLSSLVNPESVEDLKRSFGR